jgi:hypothetical protein
VLAGRERYVPQDVDIQGASGFLFEKMEGQDLDPRLRDEQQVYHDAALDLEPWLPIRTRRAGEIRSGEAIPTTGQTAMPAIDSNDVFSDSRLLIGLAANPRSREQTRAEGDGRRSTRPDSSDQIQQRPTPRSQTDSQRSVRGSETPRVPTRDDIVSPARTAPIFAMSERRRSRLKRKSIDPKLMYEGT